MTSSFDLAASLRRLKPEKQTDAPTRRNDDKLPFIAHPIRAGQPLLLDTTVYIDALQDRLPTEVAELLKIRQTRHSAIAVAELAHPLGRLDHQHPDTEKIVASICDAIERIPAHRLTAPSLRCLVDAGILTGVAARLRKMPSTQRQPLFNDAVLLLQAFEQGCCLLSRNVIDFDFLLQLMPTARVLLYKQHQ